MNTGYVPVREPTYVSITIDLGVAHVTDGVVQDRLGLRLWNRGSRRPICFPFAFAAEDCVNDNATGFLDFEELMGHGVTTSSVCDARSAHIVVWKGVRTREQRALKIPYQGSQGIYV